MEKKKRKRSRNHPWQSWFSRRQFTLLRGVDYYCSQGSFAQQLRNAAARLGLRISLDESDDPAQFSITITEVRNAVT